MFLLLAHSSIANLPLTSVAVVIIGLPPTIIEISLVSLFAPPM